MTQRRLLFFLVKSGVFFFMSEVDQPAQTISLVCFLVDALVVLLVDSLTNANGRQLFFLLGAPVLFFLQVDNLTMVDPGCFLSSWSAFFSFCRWTT